MVRLFKPLLFVLISASVSCASLTSAKKSYVVCSYDIAWDAAQAAMNGRPITVSDKSQGLIETDWTFEIPETKRSYGVLFREKQNDQERARMVLTLKRMNDVTAIALSETREHWRLSGGVRSFKWFPVEPSQAAMAEVMERLNTKLKEQGCQPG